jgi:hypothetical protein
MLTLLGISALLVTSVVTIDRLTYDTIVPFLREKISR